MLGFMVKLFLSGVVIGLVSIQVFAAPMEIEAAGPEGVLRGILISAQASDSPVALIVPGSGPTDHDGNNPLGLKTDTYRLLAEGLSAKGVSTARIDKRGMYSSAQAVKNPNAVTIDDYAADIKSWVSTLRQKTGARCIWLVGHSEGGLVSLVAVQNSEDICGLVLVAVAGKSLGQLLREQLKANPENAPIMKEAETIISKLEAGNRVDASNINPVLLPIFHPEVQGFLISELMLDPAKLVAQVKKPVLIAQGMRDIQVSVEAAGLLKNANPQAELKLLENTNHVLKTVERDDRNANLQTYSNPSLPLAANVVDSINSFIQKH